MKNIITEELAKELMEENAEKIAEIRYDLEMFRTAIGSNYISLSRKLRKKYNLRNNADIAGSLTELIDGMIAAAKEL